MANNPNWKKTERTEPKCIFIDLGAADGNTFSKFLEIHGLFAWKSLHNESEPKKGHPHVRVISKAKDGELSCLHLSA